jgi:hypothetical protein
MKEEIERVEARVEARGIPRMEKSNESPPSRSQSLLDHPRNPRRRKREKKKKKNRLHRVDSRRATSAGRRADKCHSSV